MLRGFLWLLAVSRGQIAVPALATTFASGQVSWTPGTDDHLVAGADDEQVFLELVRTPAAREPRERACDRTRGLWRTFFRWDDGLAVGEAAPLAGHHTLVPAEGFALTVHPERARAAATADGVTVAHRMDWPRRPGQWARPPLDLTE